MLPYLEHRTRFHWHIMLLTSWNYPNWIHQKHHLRFDHVALFWLACCLSAIVFGKHFQAGLQILWTNHYHNTLPILHCSTFHNYPFCLHLCRCGNLSILKWLEACNDIKLQIMIKKLAANGVKIEYSNFSYLSRWAIPGMVLYLANHFVRLNLKHDFQDTHSIRHNVNILIQYSRDFDTSFGVECMH